VDHRRHDVVEQLQRHLPDIAIAAALAWGSGLRAHAVIFALGLAGATGWLELPQHLRLLQHPVVLGASGLMTAVEFFADKLPWLDSLWDAVHSFIRIPAGAALAAAVFGDSDSAVTLAAAILGGTLSAGVHLAKAGTRAAINTSPEPFSNWTASLAEDAMVPVGLWLAFAHPILFLLLLGLFTIVAVMLLRLIWRGLQRLLA
jgi:Domain of unknown function (DUF4126)